MGLGVGFLGAGYSSVTLVGNDLTYYLSDLLLQFVDELLRVVFLCLDVAQFLLPDARQFGTLEQFLADEVYQFDACRCGYEALALLADIMALEQRLDDGGS